MKRAEIANIQVYFFMSKVREEAALVSATVDGVSGTQSHTAAKNVLKNKEALPMFVQPF